MQIFLFGGITICMSLLLNRAVSLVLCLLIVAQPLFRKNINSVLAGTVQCK